jgi:hypothetical protein
LVTPPALTALHLKDLSLVIYIAWHMAPHRRSQLTALRELVICGVEKFPIQT